MGDALHTHGGVTSAQEARLADAGLLAVQGPTALDVRTGVMAGPGVDALVLGTSYTGPMLVAVLAHQPVMSRGSANGPYRGSLDGSVFVAIGAAPAAGSRIDVVYIKQQDSTPGVPTPDAVTAPLLAVEQGASTTGTPAKPALPVGAEELATVVVAAGATRTDGAGITITNTARQTVARGAPVPVRNQADRDSLTGYNGLQVFRLDTGVYETYWSGAWRTSTPDRPWTTAVSTAVSYSQAVGSNLATVPGLTASVTVPVGRTMDVTFRAPRISIGGGAGGQLRLMVGGVQTDVADYSTGPGVSLYLPGRLDGSIVGTGVAVTIAVQGVVQAGTLLVAGANQGPVVIRHRIW